jgi:hypothetical protein
VYSFPVRQQNSELHSLFSLSKGEATFSLVIININPLPVVILLKAMPLHGDWKTTDENGKTMETKK